MKEKKRSLHLVIYPSILRKFKAIARLKNFSLSKTLEFLINQELEKYNNINNS